MTEKTPIELAVEDAQKKRALVKVEQVEQALAGLELDWRKSTAAAVIQVLCTSPCGTDDMGVPRYLSIPQARVLAWSCFEDGLNPVKNEAWINPKTGKVAYTVEGQRRIARNRNIAIGPPQKTPVEREFTAIPVSIESRDQIAKLKAAGFERDYGCACEIEVQGFKQPARYTAWLSEWYMPKNPNWKARTHHMLGVRAEGHCLESITGVGISSDILKDEAAEAGGEALAPAIVTTAVEYKPYDRNVAGMDWPHGQQRGDIHEPTNPKR